MRERSKEDGYLRLMRFMLITGFDSLANDAHLTPSERRRYAALARWWIARRGDGPGLSYDECCHWSGVDPERGRREARRLWAENWAGVEPGPAEESSSLAPEPRPVISEAV